MLGVVFSVVVSAVQDHPLPRRSPGPELSRVARAEPLHARERDSNPPLRGHCDTTTAPP